MNDGWNLSGRTALVTGGSRGLGLAIARTLCERGADVAIIARDAATVEAAATSLIQETGAKSVLPLVADVTDLRSVRDSISRVQEWRSELHILVNNAGPQITSSSIADVTEGSMNAVFDSKLMGFLRVTQAALPIMSRDGKGSIVNIAGATAHRPLPNAVMTGIVNAGVIAFTNYLATEASAWDIRVNAVSPGMTTTAGWVERTERMGADQGRSGADVRAAIASDRGVRLRRWGDPTEVGSVVSFLASDDSSYMTGQVLCVDGGMTQRIS